jgi:hypothetical protein
MNQHTEIVITRHVLAIETNRAEARMGYILQIFRIENDAETSLLSSSRTLQDLKILWKQLNVM